MAAARLGVDRALGDRTQEARLVRQALRHPPLGDHRERCRHRGDRLGDRGEDAAVHEPHRLLDLVAHRHARADALVADVDDLEAVEGVERLVQRDDRLEAHGSGTIAPAGQYAQARMSGIEDLPAEERAVLQLALRSDRPFEELAGVLELDEAEMRRHAHAALAALGPDDTADLEPARRDEISDWLLGQQSAEQRAGTERFVAGSAPARAWARVVADRLRGLGAQRVPDIPAAERSDAAGADGNGAAATTATAPAPAPAAAASASAPAAPTPAEPAAPPVGAGVTPPSAPAAAEAAFGAPAPDDGIAGAGLGTPRSSRLGGALLLGGLALVILAAGLYFAVLRGGGDSGSQKAPPAPRTSASPPPG